MSLPEKNNSQEKRNKELVESFVEEIFNNHNLSMIEKYLSPAAGKGSEGFDQFLSSFLKAFPGWQANVEHIVA
jgi:predicted SnoaL-like aldol condensation-catalyzing enzyme